MSTVIVAYYFTLLIGWHPVLAGPYFDICACDWAQEWAEARGYATETCSVMSHPQEAVLVTIGYPVLYTPERR